jgi:hypothetical protein
MLALPDDLLGRVTFVTGPGKHCGKTSFLNRALALVRRVERPAFFSIGFDGEARDTLGAAAKPEIPVEPGDVFVTAGRYLSPSGCSPELLELVPGSTAMGRLCVARASRRGAVTLAGPEHNEAVGWAARFIKEEGLARTVLVDGAINRVTQVASCSLGDAGFVYALRASRSDAAKAARAAAFAYEVANLPRWDGVAEGAVIVDGPLTASVAAALPEDARVVVVADFTKVFLDGPGLRALSAAKRVVLARTLPCLGIVATLKDVPRGEFLAAVGAAADAVRFDPYAEDAA